MAERTTSHAKEVAMESYKASLLDRYGVAKNQFDHARDPMISQQIKDMEREKTESQGRGSMMVKEDMPKSELKPPQEISKEQDNKSFNDKWKREQDGAAKDQRTKDLVERYKDYEPTNQKDERSHERDFDNSR
ncbi:MAG: hypothetical protein GY797_24975 [Deltaproteobacteria bacterium]|nr:hypothetical protein [Deltaproteobacteria bacterium]